MANARRMAEMGMAPQLAAEVKAQIESEVAPVSSVNGETGAVVLTGTDIGLNMQYREFPLAFDTTDIATGATLVTPAAGEVLLDYGLVISEAWDSSSSDSFDIGITGNTDALIDAANAQTEGLAAKGTDGADGAPYLFDGATAVIATVTSSGDAADEGAAVFFMLTRVQAA